MRCKQTTPIDWLFLQLFLARSEFAKTIQNFPRKAEVRTNKSSPVVSTTNYQLGSLLAKVYRRSLLVSNLQSWCVENNGNSMRACTCKKHSQQERTLTTFLHLFVICNICGSHSHTTIILYHNPDSGFSIKKRFITLQIIPATVGTSRIKGYKSPTVYTVNYYIQPRTNKANL